MAARVTHLDTLCIPSVRPDAAEALQSVGLGHRLRPEYRTVPVQHRAGGLAIHHALTGPGWVVSHTRSGYQVSGRCASLRAARAVQRALLALPVDWTLPRSRLARLPVALRRQIAAVLEGEGRR